jgi:alkanesulfonate monooxygenase SsuD/methylene tetrahydromethanopterin reductase-like flavin-dependent oxidoreductase (luciferase family)
MKFGVFDHLDVSGRPLEQYYEERLRVIEAFDAAGFYSYHIAEHHATPLGMAPSPSVFLAAVAQRTRNLRFGPMIYALPLYHPLRLLEEICMLDQMSGGRLDMGFGRGASPIELGIFGCDPEKAEDIYRESLEIIIKGLTEVPLTFKGKYFSLEDVPVALGPLQKPHPPIWYGVHSPDSAARAAKRGLHVISLDNAALTRTFTDRYREVLAEMGREGATDRLIGIGRFVVVAETDADAMRLARRAYPMWHDSFNSLFRRHGRTPRHQRAPDFDGLCADGMGIAGSPETVTRFLEADLAEAGANYMVGQFVFGDLTLDEALRSVGLFTRHVMPALRG